MPDGTRAANFVIGRQVGRFTWIAIVFEGELEVQRTFVETLELWSWESWEYRGKTRGWSIPLPANRQATSAGHFLKDVRFDYKAKPTKPLKATLWGARATSPLPANSGFDPTGWDLVWHTSLTPRHVTETIQLPTPLSAKRLALVWWSTKSLGIGVDLVLDRGDITPATLQIIAGAEWQARMLDVPRGRRVEKVIVHYKSDASVMTLLFGK